MNHWVEMLSTHRSHVVLILEFDLSLRLPRMRGISPHCAKDSFSTLILQTLYTLCSNWENTLVGSTIQADN